VILSQLRNLANEMNGTRAQFEEIRESYRLPPGWRTLSHQDLIVNVAALTWLTTHLVMKILHLHAKSLPVEEHYETACRICDARDDNDLHSLYQMHGRMKPIQQIILWKCALTELRFEFFLRMRRNPAGNFILRAESTNALTESDTTVVSDFRNIFIRNKDLESYRPEEYDSDDLTSEAWLNLWGRRNKSSKTCHVSLPLKLPSLPTNLGFRFRIPYRRSKTFHRMLEKLIRSYLPCLRGDFEKLRARRNRISPLLKNFFAKNETQKRTAGQVFVKNTDSEVFVYFDPCEDIETQMRRIQNNLTKCVGDRLVLAIEYIKRDSSRKKILRVVELVSKGMTVIAACRAVSITPRTFRNNVPSDLRSQILFSCGRPK